MIHKRKRPSLLSRALFVLASLGLFTQSALADRTQHGRFVDIVASGTIEAEKVHIGSTGLTDSDNFISYIQGGDDSISGPVLAFAGDAANQTNTGAIRFLEVPTEYRGMYIKFDGSANQLHLGYSAALSQGSGGDVNLVTWTRQQTQTIFAGPVQVSSGSVGAPSLADSSNTDLGWYFPANAIAASVNNSTIATIDSGGLVAGIDNFSIEASTSDTADNRRVSFGGGGAISNTRGAYIQAHGNEHATSPGDLLLVAGNVTGGSIDSYAIGKLVSSLKGVSPAFNIITTSFGEASTVSLEMDFGGSTSNTAINLDGASFGSGTNIGLNIEDITDVGTTYAITIGAGWDCQVVLDSPDASQSCCNVDNSDNFTCTGL